MESCYLSILEKVSDDTPPKDRKLNLSKIYLKQILSYVSLNTNSLEIVKAVKLVRSQELGVTTLFTFIDLPVTQSPSLFIPPQKV